MPFVSSSEKEVVLVCAETKQNEETERIIMIIFFTGLVGFMNYNNFYMGIFGGIILAFVSSYNLET